MGQELDALAWLIWPLIGKAYVQLLVSKAVYTNSASMCLGTLTLSHLVV